MIMRLKERLKFMENVPVSDGAGGTYPGFEEAYECWADVRFDSVSRGEVQGQTVNNNTVKVTMRYTPNFQPTPGNIIIWRGRMLTIHGSIDLAEKNILTFRCAYDAAKTYTQANGS